MHSILRKYKAWLEAEGVVFHQPFLSCFDVIYYHPVEQKVTVRLVLDLADRIDDPLPMLLSDGWDFEDGVDDRLTTMGPIDVSPASNQRIAWCDEASFFAANEKVITMAINGKSC